MRGKDLPNVYAVLFDKGSPPLARERHRQLLTQKKTTRITPACAGKTGWLKGQDGKWRDHPRLRGKDNSRGVIDTFMSGSPPLARERLVFQKCRILRVRITPACAGKTKKTKKDSIAGRDHPRLRGKDGLLRVTQGYSGGSPPLARERPPSNVGDY